MDSGTAIRSGDAPPKPAPPAKQPLIPPEFLKVIAVWSLVPSYMIAGAFFGWLIDQWLDTDPYVMGLSLLVALILAVRDMLRLKDEW